VAGNALRQAAGRSLCQVAVRVKPWVDIPAAAVVAGIFLMADL